MTIDEWVRELGKELGLPGLGLDENGVCGIAFDEIQLTFESMPDRSRTVVYAPLGPALFSLDSRKLLSAALSANLFGAGTSGAVLALDERKGDLVLWKTLSPETYGAIGEFVRELEAFLETAQRWRQKVLEASRLDEAAPPAAAETGGSIPSGMWRFA